ncbi:hypothetical protein EV182_001767, partial [Spiromyces aspiralis]
MPRAIPLKPIVGSFKRRIVRDVAIGTVGGFIAAHFWWTKYNDRLVKTEIYYAELNKTRETEGA